MGQPIKHAPVYFVIGQVRFNPILNIESYIATIQDAFRAKYPDFQSHSITRVNISASQPHSNDMKVEQTTRYSFANIDNSRVFIFDENALSLQITHYQGFDDLLTALLDGIQKIHDAINISFSERVGLRYLNAVIPENRPLGILLRPEVLGLSQCFSNIKHVFSETMIETESGTVASRVLIQTSPIGLPADLMAINMPLKAEFINFNAQHALLDIDAFYANREIFAISFLSNKLTKLHHDIEQSFINTITPEAITIWNRK